MNILDTIGLIVTALCLALSSHKVAGDCGELPVIANGAHEDNPSYSLGSEVRYSCEIGFEFPSLNSVETDIVCGDGDTWSTINDCEAVTCPSLPGEAELTTAEVTYGTEVTMSCSDPANKRIPGVPVGDSLTLTCEANRTWSNWNENITEACVEIACQYPMENSVGDLTDNPLSVGRNDVVSFTCDVPYYYAGGDLSKLFLCNSDGLWEEDTTSRTDIQCIADECPSLRDIFSISHVSLDPPTQFTGDEIVVSCIPGYNWNDTSTEKSATCYDNQTWSLGLYDCEPRLCPEVFELTYGNASSTDNWYPSWVNFTCIEGYWFPDGDTFRMSQCNEHGKWSEIIPQCTNDSLVIETKFETEEFAADNADRYTYIAAGIGSTVIILVIVSDIFTFPRQISFLKRNLRSKCKCLQDAEEIEEEELKSLDGDEVMKSSTVSVKARGTGRITPAPVPDSIMYDDEKGNQTPKHAAVQDI